MGGHLDTTFRGWSSTLAARVRLVISRLVLIFALPLDFHGRVRIVRSMFLPAALHGIEASFLASDSLRKLRSSIHRVVWSRRQPLASVGAVLSLLDGPTGCDPAFCVVWFRFRLLRRYLVLWPSQIGRAYRLLEMVGEGSHGHGLSIFFLLVLLRPAFGGILWLWVGLDLVLLLSNLAGAVQHFKAAVLDAWRNKVAADLCGREGFRGGPLLDAHGSLQLLNSSHVRERDKALLRGVMVGGVWNGYLLGRARGQSVPCQFCGAPDNDGHLFGECTFPPLIEVRKNPEFHDLMRMDKGHWPRCLLWHGWLSLLSGVNGASPWAAHASASAGNLLEVALGSYSSRMLSDWSVLEDFDAAEAAAGMPCVPHVWTDGSLVLDEVTGISYSGLVFLLNSLEMLIMVWFWTVRFVIKTEWGTMQPMRRLTLAEGGLIVPLLMLGDTADDVRIWPCTVGILFVGCVLELAALASS